MDTLITAIQNGDTKFIPFTDPTLIDENQNTLLHHAVNEGQLDIVQLLLQHHADPNAQNKCGNTPLHRVSSHYDITMATQILNYGASPNIQNDLGQTPLHSANTAEMISLLLKHGADATILDNDHKSPLDYNIRCGNSHIIELLVQPSLRRYPKGATTPLHYAVYYGHLEKVKILLPWYADYLEEPNEYNNTPLQLAIIIKRDDIAELIRSYNILDIKEPGVQ